jgi:hypothetical protein
MPSTKHDRPSCVTYLYAVFSTDETDEKDVKDKSNLKNRIALAKKWLRLYFTDAKQFSNTLTFGYNDEYDVDFNVMAKKSLGKLAKLPKELKKFQEGFGAKLYLEVVPRLSFTSEEPNPIITPSPAMISFLYLSKIELDIDYSIV